MEAAKQILREQGAAIDLLVIDRWFDEVSPGSIEMKIASSFCWQSIV